MMSLPAWSGTGLNNREAVSRSVELRQKRRLGEEKSVSHKTAIKG